MSRPRPAKRPLKKLKPVNELALPVADVPVRRYWLSWLCAAGLILLSTGAIGGSIWLALQLMVNPQRMLWMNQFVPDWVPIPVTGMQPPQTLAEIQRELEQVGATAGDRVPLGKNVNYLDSKISTTDWLVPVLKPRSNCPANCDRVVELRVYQIAQAARSPDDRQTYYQRVTRQAIASPEESFVIAPLTDAKSEQQGSARALPLTELQRFEGVLPSPGIWLNLSGTWERAGETVSYGKIVHYNPKRFHLSLMLDWTSPVAQAPTWQNVTGDSVPELVVNETIGLEPRFKVYQVKSIAFVANPIELEPISLFEAALHRPAYTTALMLSRSGLWSEGWKRLQSLKRQDGWSRAAQAQMDLIHLHAKATRLQAETSWASPSQQVLVAIADGQWQAALTVFEVSAVNRQEVAAMLKGDAGRLRKRIEAALKAEPAHTSVKAWGALLVAAQQDRNRAIAWLKKQPKTTATDQTRILALLDQLTHSLN
jgi:hypothetical protein